MHKTYTSFSLPAPVHKKNKRIVLTCVCFIMYEPAIIQLFCDAQGLYQIYLNLLVIKHTSPAFQTITMCKGLFQIDIKKKQ